MILYHNSRQRQWIGWLWRRCPQSACFILVEIDVVLSIANGVLRTIKGHPNEGAERARRNCWRRLQNKRFNLGGAGGMDGDDNRAGVGNGVTDLKIRNCLSRHFPVSRFQAFNE
jgi:hypothetical protein